MGGCEHRCLRVACSTKNTRGIGLLFLVFELQMKEFSILDLNIRFYKRKSLRYGAIKQLAVVGDFLAQESKTSFVTF